MNNEKIKVRITESGQTMEVVVYNKQATGIQVVLGEGVQRQVRTDADPHRACVRGIGDGARNRLRAQPRRGAGRHRPAQSETAGIQALTA